MPAPSDPELMEAFNSLSLTEPIGWRSLNVSFSLVLFPDHE